MKTIFIFLRMLLAALFMIPSAWAGGFKDNGGDGAILRKAAIVNAEEEARRLEEERVRKQKEEKERREQAQLKTTYWSYRNQFCLHAYAGFFSLILLNKPESKGPMNSEGKMNEIISTLETYCLDQNRPFDNSSFQIVKKQYSTDGQPLAFMNVPLTKISMWPERLAENLSGVLLNRYLFQALAVHEILSLLKIEKDGVYSESWQIYAKRFEIQNSYQMLADAHSANEALQNLFPDILKLYYNRIFLHSWNQFAHRIPHWIFNLYQSELTRSTLFTQYHLDLKLLLPLFKPQPSPASTFDKFSLSSQEFLHAGLWGDNLYAKALFNQSTRSEDIRIPNSEKEHPMKFVDQMGIIEKLFAPRNFEIQKSQDFECSIDKELFPNWTYEKNKTPGFIVSRLFHGRKGGNQSSLKISSLISGSNYCIHNNTFDINSMRVCDSSVQKNIEVVKLKPIAQFAIPSFPLTRDTLLKIENRLRPVLSELIAGRNLNPKVHGLMTVLDIQRHSAFAFLIENRSVYISNFRLYDPTDYINRHVNFCLDPPEYPLSLDAE